MGRAVFVTALIYLTVDMTLLEPVLLLERLRVLYSAKPVYDERFHHGVNIIRGRNSSGKSSIIDFIFFVLGGDFVGWKPEAARCDEVLAQVRVNDVAVTLRRLVAPIRRQPMYVFWGTLDEAIAAPLTSWEMYPFARTDRKESFSIKLFLKKMKYTRISSSEGQTP